MANHIGTIHDRFFKRLMENPNTANLFLREYLPENIQSLMSDNPPTLIDRDFVDDELKEHFTDLLYQVEFSSGNKAFIYILIDHKSVPDKKISVQLFRYMGQIWTYLTEQKDWHPLPRIMPMVVYHGKQKWNISTNFSDFFQKSDDELSSYFPNFEYSLIDLNTVSDENLSQNQRLRAFLTVLKHIQKPDFLDRMENILTELRWLEPVDVTTILRYIIKKWRSNIDTNTIDGMVLHIAPEKKDEIMASLVDEWIAQGEIKGEANTLMRLLSRRFGKLPDHIKDKISNANSDKIKIWIDRFVDASSLDDIFKVKKR